MNSKTILSALVGTLLCAAAGNSLAAAPAYTDKENALALAEALDKGVFRKGLISSTFIQSRSPGKYFIKVVLDNGAEQDWTLAQIRKWSKGDALTLRKNRALVFASAQSNAFVVLDKNQFVRSALEAKVYAKRHKESDILAGRTINFSIYRFNLVDLLGLAPSRDEHGYLYRYVLDLENGQRELLSYRDAHQIMRRGALMASPAAAGEVMTGPYRLRALRAHKLEKTADPGTGVFGVELVFDRPVQLKPEHFPFRIFERPHGRRRGASNGDFVIEITMPNAILSKKVRPIDNLEYLHDIRVVPDPVHQVRLLLRAGVNSDVLNVPPDVQPTGGNSVRVTFTKVTDQSVFDRKALQEADLRRRQARMIHATLTPEEIEARKGFRLDMDTGRAQLAEARTQRDFGARFEILFAALSNFRSAATRAISDEALAEALRERNALIVRLPALVLEQARKALAAGLVRDPAGLGRLLDHAAALTRESATLEAIARAKQRLAAP